MEILAIPDIHGRLSKIARIQLEIKAADLVILVGDITNFGRAQEAQEIIGRLREMNPQILAVPGNCDFPEVDSFLKAEGLSIEGGNSLLDGVGFIGVGGSLATPSKGTPHEVADEYFEHRLAIAVQGLPDGIPTVLVSHQPPFQTTADEVCKGTHVGSKTIRQFIELQQPLICFTGHIHEGVGIDSIGNTTIINPGAFFQDKYAFAKISDRIEVLEIRTLP